MTPLTYRGDNSSECYNVYKKIAQKIFHQKGIIIESMRFFMMRRRRPYWNMWRVILAYWIARYPKGFLVAIGFIIVVIYNTFRQ